ncbi:MAG: hypothetical protein LBK52_05520, partial [Deltaproteobacteria bacterium]|nr:hypothetical protein [Deltaproteobacteria bacterium]
MTQYLNSSGGFFAKQLRPAGRTDGRHLPAASGRPAARIRPNAAIQDETSWLPFPQEPVLEPWNLDSLEKLLLWGLDRNLSDLILSTGQVPWMRQHGFFRAAAKRPLTYEETASILISLTNNDAAAAIVTSGRDLDFGYELGPKGHKRRFRGNATAVSRGRGTGLTVTLRAISGRPPELAGLELEPELLESLFPPDGLVLVTGVMGSGKSTLLAAVLRHLAETGGRHIASFESPVE